MRSIIGRSPFRFAVIASLALAANTIAQDTWPLPLLGDADLHDVHFIDAQTGWAVGDRGAIWHTGNSGQAWTVQPTPVGCSLRGVYFLDARRGWAVGGSAIAYMQRSKGVVLRTDDGGRTWLKERVDSLPALRRVFFQNEKVGFAVGDGSPLFPTGAFYTTDAGRTWNPLAVKGLAGWQAADFRLTDKSAHGVLLGSLGQIVTCTAGHCLPAQTPLAKQRMHDIAWMDEQTAVAVGDEQAVWSSDDRGNSWREVKTAVNDQSGAASSPSQRTSYRAVAARGQNIWIAAWPGTSILHSSDGGRTWLARRTGTRLPISRMAFVDADRGWAVGALGLILATHDGGQTWHTQRGADRRLLALGVFARHEDIPFSLWASVAGSKGGRVRTIVVQPPADEPLTMPLTERVHAAMLSVGAHGGQTLPDRAIAGAIESWQPDWIVTNAAGSDRSPQHQTHQAVLSAIRALQEAGHSRIPSVFVPAAADAANGQLRIAATELALPMGQTVGDLSQRARSHFASRWMPETSSVAFQRAFVGNTGLGPDKGVAPDTAASRQAISAGQENWRQLQRLAQKQTLLRSLLAKAAQRPDQATAWLAQIENTVAEMPEPAAAGFLYELAHLHFERGNVQSALASLESLTRKFPRADTASAALRDATSWACSAEVNLRLERQEQDNNDKPSVPGSGPPTRFAVSGPPTGGMSLDQLIKTGPVPQGITTSAAAHNDLNDPAAEVRDPAFWQERVDPVLRAEPSLLFAIEAHRRRTTDPGIRQQAAYQRYARTAPTHTWRTCGLQELAFLQPHRQPAKPIMECKTVSRPHLDGQLDDATWQTAAAISLGSAEQSRPAAKAWIARDSEYLYLAAICRGVNPLPAKPAGPRPRDPDLTSHDRLEFFIDTDRDFATAWCLAIDDRGFVVDRLASDRRWNPKWFVAAGQVATEEGLPLWTLEAAMPLSELSEELPVTGTAWGLGIRRVIPHETVQNWPASFDSQRQQTAGILQFE